MEGRAGRPLVALPLTVRTGQATWCMTLSVTEPSAARRRPVLRGFPMTTTSARSCAASS
jgi:hypothetical protein